MDVAGEFQIPADRQAVWDALNDPEVLKQCIPGCESIETGDDNQLTATMRAKIGPVKAKFTSVITLSDLDPPNGYAIIENKATTVKDRKEAAKSPLTLELRAEKGRSSWSIMVGQPEARDFQSDRYDGQVISSLM